MEIRQLEYFLAAAKHENFSVAANELFIAQPALSKAVKKLEEELGSQLFIRKGKSIKLSPSGLELKKQLEKLLPEYYSIAPRIVEFEKNYVKKLDISMRASVAYAFGPIEEFRKVHPDVVISAGRSTYYMDYDVKFSFDTIDEDLEFKHKLKDLEVFLLAPKGSKWDQMTNITVNDIANADRIENVVSTSLQQRINDYLASTGIQLKPSVMRVCESNIMCYFVENGSGIILSPNFPGIFNRYQISLCTFEDHKLQVPLYISWPRSSYLTKTTRDFIRMTCNYYNVAPPANL